MSHQSALATPLARRNARTCVFLVLVVLLLAGIVHGPAEALSTDPVAARGPGDHPVVQGPVPADRAGSASHDYPFGAAFQDLEAAGYVEEEFFFSGTAAGQPYTSRMLVRRPADAADFSGTVVTEWTNVSNLFDFDCLWSRSAEQLMRDGDAYVAVDAQTVGVHQPGTGLKAFSPRRYESLQIPQSGTFVAELGSYEIFDQALRAIRRPSGTAPLGPLQVEHQLVTGCSQSAGTVSIYAATIGALDDLVDGYLITELSTESIDLTPVGVVFPVPTPALAGVPILQLNTENDEGQLRIEPDNDLYRLWEVAGATHTDLTSQTHAERIAARDLELRLRPYGCDLPPLSRIPFAHVQNAALRALKAWVREGVVPPSFPQIRSEAGEIVRDRHGNALGGIRLPEHVVPTATNSSINSGPQVCTQLMGSHLPFSAALLQRLYPTHADYVDAFTRATQRAMRAGFLLPHDARSSLRAARAADIPHERSR